MTDILFAFVGEQLKQDIPFLLLVCVLTHFNVITVQFPHWLTKAFEPQDLAPLPRTIGESDESQREL